MSKCNYDKYFVLSCKKSTAPILYYRVLYNMMECVYSSSAGP